MVWSAAQCFLYHLAETEASGFREKVASRKFNSVLSFSYSMDSFIPASAGIASEIS